MYAMVVGGEREPAMRLAIKYFSNAVARDSSYADAYAALATSYGFLTTGNVSDFPTRVAADSARYFAARALALNDSVPEAYEARAFVKMLSDFDWRGADADARRAVEINPYYTRRTLVRAIMY